LSNKSFISRAPKEKVELEKKKYEDYLSQRDALLLLIKNNK
jgi:hypothetical protein